MGHPSNWWQLPPIATNSQLLVAIGGCWWHGPKATNCWQLLPMGSNCQQPFPIDAPTPPPGPPPLAHAVGGTSAALAMPLDTAPVVAKWGAGQFGWGWQVAWQAACDFITYTCPMHPTCQATPQNKRNASVTISEHVHVLKSTPSHTWHVKWGTPLWLWGQPWHAVGAMMTCAVGAAMARAVGGAMACSVGATMACVCVCSGGSYGMCYGGGHGMCVCMCVIVWWWCGGGGDGGAWWW